MRQQWEPIAGGTPVLRLWPEHEREAQLTATERALLRATLAVVMQQHAELNEQVESARCACRHFTGYGAFIGLTVPCSVRTVQAERALGEASLNWQEARKADLYTVAFLEDGRLATLEAFPSDGQNWSVEECREILAAPLSSVVIRSMDG